MMRNVYTHHEADRYYDINNNEVKLSRRYAQNNYDAKRPVNRFYEEDTREAFRSEYREPIADRQPRQPKKSRAGLITATVALTLAVVMAAGTIVFFATKNNKLTATQQPSVSTVTTSNDSALSNNAATQAPAENATKAKAAEAAQATEAAKATEAAQATEAAKTAEAPQASGTTDAAMNVAKTVYGGHNLEKTAEENVVRVDGERIYMDTKRTAPAGTGNPSHFYANGKTSYGFDWTYETDNANFVISCNYNFAKQQYDFVFYGTQAGTSHVTVYYNTSDSTKVPVKLTLNVDNNLNVTQA